MGCGVASSPAAVPSTCTRGLLLSSLLSPLLLLPEEPPLDRRCDRDRDLRLDFRDDLWRPRLFLCLCDFFDFLCLLWRLVLCALLLLLLLLSPLRRDRDRDRLVRR